MHIIPRPRFGLLGCAVNVGIVLAASFTHAANLTWDSSGAHPAAPVDGGGLWDTTVTNLFWSTGAADQVWDNASMAVFGGASGTPGTVTIDDGSGTVSAAGLTFNVSGYTIAASGADTLTLNVANPIINTASGKSAVISAPIAGNFNSYTGGATITGLLLNGTGTLSLSGTNTYSGSTIIANNGVANSGTSALLTGGSFGSASANMYVGLNPTSATTDTSSLTLSGSSSLSASTLVVDFNFAQGTISTTSGAVLNVNGTNTINANNIVITAGRNSGNTKGGFGTLKLGSGASMSLNDAANDGGAVTLLDIASYSFETGGATGTGIAGTVDFSAGTINGTINTVNIATGKAGTGAGGAGTSVGSLLFANGTLNASTINIARFGSQPATGTLSLIAGGTGTITAGTGAGSSAITFGATGQGTQGTGTSSNGSINIAGGTLNVNGDIISNPGASVRVSTATINLSGGTLNMQGNNIGPSGTAITLVASAGTLENVNSINASGNGSSGLTMSGTGAQILTLLGTNSYTGATTVSGGTLVANGAASMGTGGALAVNGGTLDLHGFGQSVVSLSGTGASGVITNGIGTPVTLTVTSGSGAYAGVIQDGGSGKTMGLSITGGTANLSSATAQTYTGNTTVSNGAALTVANFNSSTAITVNGTLAAGGTVGSLLVDSAGSLTPGPTVASGNTGILNASGLTIGSGGASLNFRANSAATFDQLLLTGAATLNGGLTVNATLSGTMSSGTYTLLSAPNGLILNGNTITNNPVTVAGGGTTRLSGILQETATQIQLLVNGSPASLTWTGSNDTTTWDTVNHPNWTSTAPSDPNRFYQLDSVTFDNSSANLNVNITVPVQPGSVTFNNNNSHNYVISSTNGSGIGDSGTGTNLTVNGAGSVTLNTVNTYAGNTTVNNGTLIIGGTGSIAGNSLSVASGAATTVNAGGSITTTALNVSGTITANGTVGGATLTLSSPAIATVTSTGTLNTPTVSINGGASMTVQTSGSLASTSVTVANGASLNVQAGGSITAAPTLVNNGTVTFGSDQTIGSLSGADPTATITQTGTLTVGLSGTYAGIVKDGVTGGLTVSANTLTLTGANLYTGNTTINSGATLIVDTGSNTGSLSTATAITVNGTLIYGLTGPQSLANTLSGTGAFRQNGGGKMTLTGSNTGFTGAIQAYNGTVVQNSASSLGTGGGGFVLGAPEPAGAPSNTTPGNITFISSVPSTSVGSISSTAGSTTANPIPSVLTIPAGVVLTDSGVLTLGPNNSTAAVFSSLSATGGGALVVNGTVNVSQTNSVASLDLSGLSSTNFTGGTFNIVNGAGLQGTVTLANTTLGIVAPVNSISTVAINIATTGTNNPNGNSSVLNLGSGSNSLFANSINLGTGRGSAIIQFVPGAAATASVTIADQSGLGSAAIVLCNASTNGTQGGAGSFLNLAGFNATVNASSLIIAENTGNLAGGAIAGVTFDTGTFNVNGTVTIAADTGGSSTTGPTGNLTIGGSTPNITATGSFTAGGITLGNFTNGNQFSVASAVATATFTINGGSANITGNIANTSTQGTTISTLNLRAGTLNMNGNAIGGNAGVNSGNGLITVNLPASGQSATLANLGGGGINGAGLTMDGAGTLILDGDSTYSGGTNINSGTLQVGQASSPIINTALGSDPVLINTTLNFASNKSIAVGNVINGGGQLNQTGAGTTTLSGSNGFTGNATISRGKLILGSIDALGHASKIILSGGALGTGGVNSTTTAPLRVSAPSTIDLGNGMSTLHLADSSSETWASSPAGSLLRISNWTDGTNHVLFDTTLGTGLTGNSTTGQVSQIHFTGFRGTAMLLAAGPNLTELVPPSTVIGNTLLRGDFTGDHAYAANDLDAMFVALTNPTAFKNNYAGGALTAYEFPDVADVNNDGAVDNGDIQAEISLLINGVLPTASLAAPVPVPEPSGFLLFGLGGLWFLSNCARRKLQPDEKVQPY